MSKYNYDNQEVKRLSKYLIPVNIVVAILCIVAAVSIIFAPIIKIDVGKVMKEVPELMQTENNGSSSDSNSNVSADDTMSLVMGSITDLVDGIDFKISMSAWNMNELGTTQNPTTYLMNTVLVDSGMLKSLGLLSINMSVVTPSLTDSMKDIVEEQVKDQIDEESGSEESSKSGIETKILLEVMTQLDWSKFGKIVETFSSKDKDTVINEYIAEAKAQVGNISFTCTDGEYTVNVTAGMLKVDETKITESLSDIYGFGTVEGGKFSIESAVCSQLGDSFKHSLDDETASKVPEFKTYKDVIGFFTDSDSVAQEIEGLKDMVKPISDLNTTLSDAMKYMSYVFYVFLAFAGVWLILFLFSFIHIFLKNKRFTMWYVKILGGIPGLIFIIIALLKPIVSAVMPADQVANILPILGCISSGMWIPMACYIALWLVSICWAFPIKRKIRKVLKNS